MATTASAAPGTGARDLGCGRSCNCSAAQSPGPGAPEGPKAPGPGPGGIAREQVEPELIEIGRCGIRISTTCGEIHRARMGFEQVIN